MDEHLSRHAWFAAGAFSLADICLYAYTHVAPDAEFDLSRYPRVVEWIGRIEADPRYIPIDA